MHAGFVAVVQVRFFGDDQPDRDGEDTDFGTPLEGERARQVDETGFGRAIRDALGVGPLAADARDVDDEPAVAVHHRGIDRLRERHRGEQVELHDAFVEARRDRRRIGRRCTAGVVDEYVDVAELVDGGLRDGLALVGVAHVAHDEGGGLATGAHRFGRWVAGTHDDVGAVLHERRRHDPADAFRAAGHDDALASEVERIWSRARAAL